jgi:peptidoglycan-associated lipoprotein
VITLCRRIPPQRLERLLPASGWSGFPATWKAQEERLDSMRFTMGRVGLLAFAAVALALGCASTPEQDSTSGTGSDADSSGGFSGGGGFEGNEVRTSAEDLESVYFDYDMALIRDDQKPTLRTNASAIQQGTYDQITIEGHCDERGSEEYNLALGERRANAVKRYLSTLGIPEAKLDTVSFGESKPAVQGHDEAAWRWNRRAEFRVAQ